MQRSVFSWSLILAVTVLWSTVSSGVEDKNGAVPIGSLCAGCHSRIKEVMSSKSWTLTDSLATSYGVLSFNIFKFDIPKPQDVCKFLKSSLDELDGTKTEPAFAITAAIAGVPTCKANPLKPALKQALEKITKEGGSAQDIFYAAEALRNTGAVVDGAKLGDLLKASTKTDDSPQSLGYALWAASNSYKAGQKLEIWDRIEDVIAQADEVDKIYLQFEGGLSVTAAVVNGIFRLSQAANKAVPLKNDQVVKLGNYLISRKTVNTPRGIWLFASALDIVANNKFVNPVYVGLSGSNVLNDGNKVLTIRASDLLGRPVDVSVLLESVTDSNGKKIADIQTVQAVPAADKTTFNIDLKAKSLPKGFYKAVLVPKSPKNDKKLILLPTTVQIKVVGKLGTVTTRVGVADADQQSKTQWNDLNRNQKLPSRLELEASQRLVVKIAASDSLHQVFVLLRNKETKKEVAFIAQPETEGKTDYKLELDLSTNAKDLGYQSGVYELVLVLGDFLVEDSLEWPLGEVNLQVAGGKVKSVNPLYSVVYGPKPEIKHQFRTPEPRPPRFLSDTFTVLVLSPILILLILWIKIGANIKGFPLSLSALGFHLGLAGIFGVYLLFWLKLTMFEALKLVSIPGAITFICGHRLLSYLSATRKG